MMFWIGLITGPLTIYILLLTVDYYWEDVKELDGNYWRGMTK